MVFNTVTVGTAVTPAVVDTLFAHYLSRKPRRQKPTAHLSYDEGLALIRKFLLYASHHTVEDLQRFTSQWVPHPRWVKVDEVTIDEKHITAAAETLQAQLRADGIQQIGGKSWWQWRRPGSKLAAEWIEMRSDYHERKKNKDEGKRVMLYVHGGAYFFGSVDEHRYQMQRHARKLKARVFAPRYRLAPQFPFPCGLHDCLAAYMYLLTVQDPSTIILAGDSAGGGMVLSLMVCLRDQGIPLPAGAILISPWVDLTHSFPSVAGSSRFDYIPEHGFHQRPSASWPPPNADDMAAIRTAGKKAVIETSSQEQKDAVRGFSVDDNVDPAMRNATAAASTAEKLAVNDSGNITTRARSDTANTLPKQGQNLSIMLDGKLIEIKDQIQMYASNELLSHPLVSPILQPSLGGLPPMLILVGGGEMLRDEQIYLAHKAANPELHPPGDAYLNEHPDAREQLKRWKPTDVQLQVWDDLCHVAPTLSFTRPAKYMYRSIAQFGAWALARAQKTDIDILDDDNVSIISQSSDTESDENPAEKETETSSHVGKAGDRLPPFKNHMIRQRVDRHGIIFPLAAPSDLPGCCMKPEDIGVIKPGPVRKWMEAKTKWDTKYASTKRRVQEKRIKEMAKGYHTFGNGEIPPPSALAGRIKSGEVYGEPKKERSWGMSLWALWGSQHDKDTMEREEKADKTQETTGDVNRHRDGVRSADGHVDDADTRLNAHASPRKGELSRSRSRRRVVSDENQTGDASDGILEKGLAAALLGTHDQDVESPMGENPPMSIEAIPQVLVRSPTVETMGNQTDLTLKRPKLEGVAFPFTVKKDHDPESASMLTLTSAAGVSPHVEVTAKEAAVDSGKFMNGDAGLEAH